MSAWGCAASLGVEDLVEGVRSQRLSSVCILRHRRFGAAETRAMAAAIRESSSLTELHCSSHELDVEDVRALGEAIAASRSMRVVDVGGRRLGDEGAAVLSACARCPTLRVVDLEAKSVGDEGLRAWARELATSGVEDFTASRNCFGDDGLAALAAASSRLRKVDVSDNGAVTRGVAALIHPGLEELRCRNLTAGALDVVAAAGAMRSLTHLDASGCSLASPDVEALAPAMGCLRELRLARNELIDSAADTLAHAFRRDVDLDVLDLASNRLSGRAIATILATRAVARIDASDNPIAEDVALIAAELAATPDRAKRRLVALGLNAVGLDDRGAGDLAAALALEACTLTEVQVGGNVALGRSGIEALRQAASKRLDLDVAGLPPDS